jgi:hypothetical protein
MQSLLAGVIDLLLLALFFALIFRPWILQKITGKQWDKWTDTLVDYPRRP